MITNLLKIILALLCISMFFYCASVFDFSAGLLIFPAFALFVIVSIFYNKIAFAATILCRIIGIISVLSFLLLMLAGTVGGSFNLSPSNQVVAALLFSMSILGLSSFFWSSNGKKST